MRHLRWLLGWGVLTALVVVSARTVAWGPVVDAAASAHPGWLALAVAANGAILVLATAQWLLFLPGGTRVPPWTMFGILAVTSSVSNGGPFLAGHATGIHLLATRGGLGHAGGVSLTVLDQVAEGLAKWSIVALAAALVPGFEYRAVGLTIVLGAPALAVGVGVLQSRRHSLDRWASRASGVWARALGFAASAVHRLEAIRSPARFGAGVALAILQKGAEALAIAAVAAALGVPLPVWLLVAVLVAVNLSTLLSVTPANLGIYEGAAVLVLRAAGVEMNAALVLALVAHAAYLLPLAGTGWLLESVRLARGIHRAHPPAGGPLGRG